MYTILHLPSNTLYSLRKTPERHTVVFFKQYDNAKYVADSLSTHYWIYGKMPNVSKELHLMKPYQKKRESLEHHIWVQEKPFSRHCAIELGSRNLDVVVVKDIMWLDDDEYDLNIQHFSLECEEEVYLQMMELDHDIVI